MQFIVNRCAGN